MDVLDLKIKEEPSSLELIDDSIKLINTEGISITTETQQSENEDCTICYSTDNDKGGFVRYVCCGKTIHKICLTECHQHQHITCPFCRSNQKEAAVREEITCAICKGAYKDTDAVITINCKKPINFVDEVSNYWSNGKGTILGLAAAAVGNIVGSKKDVDHYFHEGCIRLYYATDKKSYFENLGKIVYYCPIHKEEPIVLPSSIQGLQLADQTNMTEEEVLAVAREEEEKEIANEKLNRLLKQAGGTGLPSRNSIT